jgi:hypothetical protein
MTVTQDMLSNALDARGAKPDCPMCDQNQWLSMSLSGEMETLVLHTGLRASDTGGSAGRVDLDSGFAVVGLYCSNCGFLRLHRLDVLGL